MPVSLKQIEAFYWTAKLGGFTEAAERLHLAQSTISKRILELEDVIKEPLFDRASYALRLTRAGAASLPIATEMLTLETRFREVAGGSGTFSGPFRFGVTELVALTWLPKLIVAMKREYPNLIPEPEVAASIDLYGKLAANEIDLVIGLDPPQTPNLLLVPLGAVQLEWVAAPGFGPAEDCIPLHEMAKYPILSQTQGSGLQRLVLDWAVANGLRINRVVQCNSLNVLAGLAASGLGVTFLTASYFADEIRRGRLRVIRTEPAIPPIRYFAVRRAEDLSPLAGRIADIAQVSCDFSARSLPGR
ncbi:LysR family transcriptional regulator [Bradyrhizobium frederickii]|uniref:LysR family transcriptional regulator n=1 Tax=Bradyrhizobium frederickii TaxID=2560054 RepID=A0A4Y9PHW8_9BRAD|nr:LysR family transcriptional regulator [Bradyrhizobium frederickii]TFV79750.1 LysR family transcriptional regulator [Bradyrhizobium frederickii]